MIKLSIQLILHQTASTREDSSVRASLATTEIGMRADATRGQDRSHPTNSQGPIETERKSRGMRRIQVASRRTNSKYFPKSYFRFFKLKQINRKYF